VFQQPVVDADDYFTEASLNENRVATAALLELIMGMAVAGIAIAIYPVLTRFSERLALGYVVVRTIEGMLIVIGTIGGLTLLTVGQEYVNAGTSDASLQTLGGALLAERDWVNHAVLPIVFPLGALILNYALYQARLVPRWLSVWGLGGAALWLATGVMVTYGLEPMPVLAAGGPAGDGARAVADRQRIQRGCIRVRARNGTSCGRRLDCSHLDHKELARGRPQLPIKESTMGRQGRPIRSTR